MQHEIDALKDMPLHVQLAHIKKYLQYIFQGDNPEKYLETIFPTLYQVYLLILKYESLANEENANDFQNFIAQNIHNLAKELRSIRLDIIDWIDNS